MKLDLNLIFQFFDIIYIIVTMTISVAVCDIFGVKEWRDLENQASGCSRSLKMAPFGRPYATSYWAAVLNIAPNYTISELFDVE